MQLVDKIDDNIKSREDRCKSELLDFYETNEEDYGVFKNRAKILVNSSFNNEDISKTDEYVRDEMYKYYLDCQLGIYDFSDDSDDSDYEYSSDEEDDLIDYWKK